MKGQNLFFGTKKNMRKSAKRVSFKETGNIIVQLQSPAEEITNIKYIISGPSSAETFDRIGDDIEIEFNFAE